MLPLGGGNRVSKNKIIAVVLVLVIVVASVGAILWWKSKPTVNTPPQHLLTHDIVTDTEGNLHIAFFPHYYMKLDPELNVLISKELNTTFGTNECIFPSIMIDSDNNVHILFQNDYFKIDEKGNVLLEKINFLPKNTFHSVISKTSNDEIIILYSIPSEGLFFIKQDKNGTVQIEAKKVANSPSIFDSDIMDHIYVAGDSLYIIDFNGTLLKEKSLKNGFKRIAIDGQNNIHVVYKEGYSYPQYPYNGSSVHYMKLNETLYELSNTQLSPNSTSTSVPEISIDFADNVYIYWSDQKIINNESGRRIIKFNSNGTVAIQEKILSSFPGGSSKIMAHKGQKGEFLFVAISKRNPSNNDILVGKLDTECNVLIELKKLYSGA